MGFAYSPNDLLSAGSTYVFLFLFMKQDVSTNRVLE